MKELVSTCVRGEHLLQHLQPPRCRSSALLGLEHAPFSAATQELSAPLALGLVLRHHDEFLRLVCLRGSKRTIASSHQRLVSSSGRFLKSVKEVLALERDEVRLWLLLPKEEQQRCFSLAPSFLSLLPSVFPAWPLQIGQRFNQGLEGVKATSAP